jgi:hypothetical protein
VVVASPADVAAVEATAVEVEVVTVAAVEATAAV